MLAVLDEIPPPPPPPPPPPLSLSLSCVCALYFVDHRLIEPFQTNPKHLEMLEEL